MLQNDKKYKDSTDTNISKNTTNVAFYLCPSGVFTVIAFHIYICYSEYTGSPPTLRTGHFLYSLPGERGFTKYHTAYRAYCLAEAASVFLSLMSQKKGHRTMKRGYRTIYSHN